MGNPSYKRAGDGWFLWKDPDLVEWYITIAKAMPEPPLWLREDPDIEGDYQPQAATGIATVTEV